MSESDSNHLTGRDWLWLGLICSFGLGSVATQMAWVLALLGGYLFWRKGAAVIDPSLRQMWFWLGCLAIPALCSIFDSTFNKIMPINYISFYSKEYVIFIYCFRIN